MYVDGLENRNAKTNCFFGAAYARSADSYWPYVGSFVEWLRGAGCVRCRTFATQFVQAPAAAVAIVAELFCEATGVKVRATRTVIMNQAVVSKLRTVELIERRQLAHGGVFEHGA